jgi:hypothetical protein
MVIIRSFFSHRIHICFYFFYLFLKLLCFFCLIVQKFPYLFKLLLVEGNFTQRCFTFPQCLLSFISDYTLFLLVFLLKLIKSLTILKPQGIELLMET